MKRPATSLGVLALAVGAVCATACEGTQEEIPAEAVEAAVSGSLIRSTWMVQVAEPGKLDALAGQAGWQAFHTRSYGQALAASADWAGAGRVHAEVSALYRQAALLAARAFDETYREDQRREGDPVEVTYLLGVARVILGDVDGARTHFGQVGSSTVAEVIAADTAWSARLEGAADCVALAGELAVFELPEPAAGVLPEPPPAPHYELPETVGERRVRSADPTVLLQLAAWHEAAAIAAIGEDRAGALIDPWRLACEPAPAARATPPVLEDLFLSGFASAADLTWAATGEPPSSRADTSPYASVLAPCQTVEDRFDPTCAGDAARKLQDQVEAAMEKVAGGPSPNHRAMAAFTEVGVLRAGVRVADALGDREAAGLLRISAKDQPDEGAAEPVFLMSLAAWDVGNRNPLRAQELLHAQVARAPGLDAARYALDSLHLRVSRDTTPGMPMH